MRTRKEKTRKEEKDNASFLAPLLFFDVEIPFQQILQKQTKAKVFRIRTSAILYEMTLFTANHAYVHNNLLFS